MNLSSFSVRQKLTLLLFVPLGVMIFMAVPFIAERTSVARAASATAIAASTAGEVSAVVQDVQRERLLALGYLVASPASRTALISAGQDVRDRTADLRTRLGPRMNAELGEALTTLDGLSALRERVLGRVVPASEAYQRFGESVQALLGALDLGGRANVDPAGARDVDSLDALLRANEASSQVGAALLVCIADKQTGSALLGDANAARQLYGQRYTSLAPEEQARLLETVAAGSSNQGVEALTTAVRQPDIPDVNSLAAAVVSASQALSGPQQLVQNTVVQDVRDAASGRAAGATIAALASTVLAVLLFAVVFGLILAVGRSIAQPLRRLTRAARSVADLANAELLRVSDKEGAEGPAPRLAAIDAQSDDEIGELAAAFNRVQATAALLLERQLVSRRNVSTMFSNVGRRTQNLVGRQLALLEELERDETDPQLLAALYRLDHVCTRLRRSAYSLLVVAGATEEHYDAHPTLLANVVRAALGEIEGFQSVRLNDIAEVTVAAHVVSDLTLLIAELLENATSFSPPGSFVGVYARSGGDGCRLTIVDHGIGMSDSALAEENRRLVERERLDIAPTSTLGLFVVGRLARRHGLQVRLASTAGRGVTVLIDIPNSLLVAESGEQRRESDSRVGRLDAPPPRPDLASVELRTGRNLVLTNATRTDTVGDDEFPWFVGDASDSEEPTQQTDSSYEAAPEFNLAQPPPPPPITSEVDVTTTSSDAVSTERIQIPAGPERPSEPRRQDGTPSEPQPPTRGGLQRRVPSAQLFDLGEVSPSVGGIVIRDPAADRAAMEALEAGAARAARELPAPGRPQSANEVSDSDPSKRISPADPEPAVAAEQPQPASGHPGLERRIPGAALAAPLREAISAPADASSGGPGQHRNPEAERDSINAFLHGFAEGSGSAPESVPISIFDTGGIEREEGER